LGVCQGPEACHEGGLVHFVKTTTVTIGIRIAIEFTTKITTLYENQQTISLFQTFHIIIVVVVIDVVIMTIITIITALH